MKAPSFDQNLVLSFLIYIIILLFPPTYIYLYIYIYTYIIYILYILYILYIYIYINRALFFEQKLYCKDILVRRKFLKSRKSQKLKLFKNKGRNRGSKLLKKWKRLIGLKEEQYVHPLFKRKKLKRQNASKHYVQHVHME